MAKVAVPLACKLENPSICVVPSLVAKNVTVPVGAGAEPEIVAVRITLVVLVVDDVELVTAAPEAWTPVPVNGIGPDPPAPPAVAIVVDPERSPSATG